MALEIKMTCEKCRRPLAADGETYLQLRMHFLSGMHREAECDLSELRQRTSAATASRSI